MLGGFSLKSLLFPRASGQARQSDLVHGVWAKLIKLVEEKKIDPLVDSEWSFEEVSFLALSSRTRSAETSRRIRCLFQI